jgi:hypothetical protein
LYVNFYSRTPTVRGGFWIIYEGLSFSVSFYCLIIEFDFSIKASHPNAEVHLHCGPREKLGVPLKTTLSPPISSSYNHGWSRLAFNNPPNPTISIDDQLMYRRLSVTTPRLSLAKNYSKYLSHTE